MHAILAEYGLPQFYPKEVEEKCRALDENIAYGEEYQREDSREVTTFTIDPTDAKDFDDALSLRPPHRKRSVGGRRGILPTLLRLRARGRPHRPRSRQACYRIYLVVCTIPMLPERLSNNLCPLCYT